MIYNQENPEEVDIDSVFRLEILPRILVVLGIIMLTLGLLGYLDGTELNFKND